jgi:Outer membrane protein beta-barrel domain
MHQFIKYILFSLLIICNCFFSFGQIRETALNQPDYDSKKIHLGIAFGINRSHYNILHSPTFINFDSINVIESINNTGLNLSWTVDYKLGTHFSLRTRPVDVSYTEKAFQYTLKTPDRLRKEDTITTQKVEGISFGIPLQLKFASDRINNFKVYILAGARIDYDFASNVDKKENNEALTLKKIDFSTEIGIGFHFYLPFLVLTPEIKMAHSLRNIIAKTNTLKYANTIDNLSARSITFSLTFE